MRPDELREAYLSFFESKGHTRHPSDSLVPSNDPTLLFTGAGMNQFKEMFLGVGNLDFRRATTAQKCFRTGDLDNVGRTFYHHTFFEMLGNFSFGDYFKREAIRWAWEFVTKVMKLPAERLQVSVHEDDDEAYGIWRDEVGLPAAKIWRLDARHNYWPANAPADGPNGPCGPCSEIFWDYGSPGEAGDPEAERYCEFWNLVFQQFNRTGVNELVPLGQTGIDTGMGFERMLAILNGKRSNFETALFQPIIQRVADIARVPYTYDHPLGPQFRRIADHVRAATFLIADGVKPSNEGRGYVARRVLRRAVRDAIALGVTRPALHELVPTVVEIMGQAYPELRRAEGAATAFLKAEDEKFRETFETGMALLEREIAALRGGSEVFPGAAAFVLYDSHGFPLELCEEICAERGLRVDRAGFDACMEEQRARSREGSTMGGEVFVATAISALKKEVATTEFVGHTERSAESEVSAAIRGEEPVARIGVADGDTRLITRATPFYAEAGGQVGDTGVIEGPHGKFRVADTQRVEGYIVHYGRVEEGVIHRGDPVALRVDAARRAAIQRNHTATHLLHAALRTILGTHVTQAGSRVDPERLRFDFTHPRGVKPDELAAIETWVNDEILLNSEVFTSVRPLEEARAAGAMALFGEKYGEFVRVVVVGEHSMELCGGTHVASSAEIGTGLLTQESSVASGVRRIEMVTGLGALDLARHQRAALRSLADALKTAPEGLGHRLEALQGELRDLKRSASERRRESGLAAVDTLLSGAVDAGGIKVVVGAVDGDDAAALRSVGDAVRARAPEHVLVLAGRGAAGVALLATASDRAVQAGLKAGDVLQRVAKPLGGKGGGRPQMAQGRAPAAEGLEAALDRVRSELVAQLATN